MVLRTVRLRLERPKLRDAPALTPLWRDGRVQRYLGGAVAEDTAYERFAGILAHRDEHGCGVCAVRERSTGRLAGLCGLGHLDGEAAYKLWPAFWGKGYATEAARASLGYGFRGLRPERIVAVARRANLRSRHVLEKIGMRYERDATMWGARQRF